MFVLNILGQEHIHTWYVDIYQVPGIYVNMYQVLVKYDFYACMGVLVTRDEIPRDQFSGHRLLLIEGVMVQTVVLRGAIVNRTKYC